MTQRIQIDHRQDAEEIDLALHVVTGTVDVTGAAPDLLGIATVAQEIATETNVMILMTATSGENGAAVTAPLVVRMIGVIVIGIETVMTAAKTIVDVEETRTKIPTLVKAVQSTVAVVTEMIKAAATAMKTVIGVIDAIRTIIGGVEVARTAATEAKILWIVVSKTRMSVALNRVSTSRTRRLRSK